MSLIMFYRGPGWDPGETTIVARGFQFPVLSLVICFEFLAFPLEIGPLDICLRVHGHVLAGRHRHSPGDQSGDSCDDYVTALRQLPQGEEESRPSFLGTHSEPNRQA